jgi:predicted DCC family thiol-disulfide oxidoreductase YuxK
VSRLNVRQRFEVLPYQTGGLLERVGLTEQQCQEAAWFVESDGRHHRGAAAINAALDALGGVWRVAAWLYRIPAITQAENRLYGWIARNRYRLPGSTDACHIADKRPTPRDRV